MRPPETFEELDNARARLAPEDLRFERLIAYVMLSVLAWNAFWHHADRLADNADAQVLAWTAVLTAILAAYNL